MWYQDRDWEVVDYQAYSLFGGMELRGPKPDLTKEKYFVCIGAAQTLGCYCRDPYPALLERELGISALNLGVGGAGPAFFLNQPRLLKYVEDARFAVIQVMSGRSADNSLFKTIRGCGGSLERISDGKVLHYRSAYQEILETDVSWWTPSIGKAHVQRLAALFSSNRNARRIVEETRENWIKDFRELLRAIRIPKVLLWFSERAPHYKERYFHPYFLFGKFPQLVNREMLRRITRHSDEYVECVSRAGMPHRLTNRFTGKRVVIDTRRLDPKIQRRPYSYNREYPSPSMHIEAARLLKPVCEKLLKL